MSRFVNSFWGADGFDVIEKRLDQGMKSSDMLTYYVVERSNIEKGYAEKLQSLIRKTQALTEVGSSREAWLSMRGETDNLANVHLEFAKQLNEKIGVPMAKFKEDQRKLRKQYLGDAAKLNREMAKIKVRKSNLNLNSFFYFFESFAFCLWFAMFFAFLFVER